MLETICTDYKSSKELRKLGINLKTYFYWDIETKTIDLDRMPVDKNPKAFIFPAYTSDQILHLLPNHIVRKEKSDIILSLDIFPYKSLIYSNEYVDQDNLYTIEEEFKPGDNFATLAARLIIQINKLC